MIHILKLYNQDCIFYDIPQCIVLPTAYYSGKIRPFLTMGFFRTQLVWSNYYFRTILLAISIISFESIKTNTLSTDLEFHATKSGYSINGRPNTYIVSFPGNPTLPALPINNAATLFSLFSFSYYFNILFIISAVGVTKYL